LSEIYNNLGEVLKNNKVDTVEIDNNKISGEKISDQLMESFLEKYSNLLVKKFEEKLNKK
jgi:hypothetical protein